MCEGKSDGKIGSANDNGEASDGVRIQYQKRIDDAVSSIARLIGRQMAQEDHEAMSAANDNSSGISRPLEDM